MVSQRDDVELFHEEDRLFVRLSGEEDATPVRLVWARPLSSRGGEVSLVDEKKREVLMLESLDVLRPESRRVAEEELERRYVLPRVTRVLRTTADFGMRYWHVETTLGERRFALKNASKTVVWLSDEHLVLHDTMGCRYEINPFSALDPRSQAEVEKVL